jgi:hypothetical protein
MKSLFADCKPATDSTRVKQDGWVSQIGQNGKTISVLDYRIDE